MNLSCLLVKSFLFKLKWKQCNRHAIRSIFVCNEGSLSLVWRRKWRFFQGTFGRFHSSHSYSFYLCVQIIFYNTDNKLHPYQSLPVFPLTIHSPFSSTIVRFLPDVSSFLLYTLSTQLCSPTLLLYMHIWMAFFKFLRYFVESKLCLRRSQFHSKQ